VIAVVDYGAGNLRSVERALAHAGANPHVTADGDDLARSNGIVLPGVGAFGPALARLEAGNLGRTIVDLVKRGKPLLGVCLGYQLLFTESSERGRHDGLGLLEGRVEQVSGSQRLPVIGWCRTRQVEFSPLLDGIADGAYFYYVHSYTPVGATDAVATTETAPAAAAARVNVMGTQFHPEKSGADGLRIYMNFLGICGDG
jgi:glutamine amidotransferase